jgi:hypothetical protein
MYLRTVQEKSGSERPWNPVKAPPRAHGAGGSPSLFYVTQGEDRMRFQDHVVALTRSLGDALFQSARAMPPEKLDWKPLDAGRSAIEMLQECAGSPTFVPDVLRGEGATAGAETAKQVRKERATWRTLDECESAYRANVEPALAAIRDYPDDQMDALLAMPFAPGLEWPATHIIMDMYWNMTYHLGQINYIQTLYGDKKMHSAM